MIMKMKPTEYLSRDTETVADSLAAMIKRELNTFSCSQSRVTYKTKKRNVKIKKASRSNTLIPSQVVSSRTTKDIVTDQFISSTTPSTISIAAYTQPIMKQVSGPSVGQLSLPLSASGQVDIDDEAIVAMWNNC